MSTNLPQWQRERAQKLDAICQFVESLIPAEGKMEAVAKAALQFDGIELPNGAAGTKQLRLSKATMYRLWKLWHAHGKTPAAFALRYTGGRAALLADELVTLWRQKLTNRGKQSASQIYKELARAWAHGHDIPGLGNWREWWAHQHPTLPVPHKAPEFPVGYGVLMKFSPAKVTRDLGNFGLVAARESIRHIQRDSSLLRPAEVFTLDDKDGDQKVIDDVYGTRTICKPTMYFLMDIGPRYIVSFMIRPTKALAADVDELIAQGLRTYGRGNGYATHILFERGTTACTEAREQYFNALFPNQLFVHRTGMIQGYAYAGQWKENATGKPCSKGMIEAFNGKLDILLQAIPGKDGRVALTRHTEDLLAIEAATGLSLNAPLLRLSQFALIVRKAVELYNADHRHEMQGFHKIDQIETAPGVWCDLPAVTTGELHAAIA
jgi:hypothetical protein